MTPAKKAFYEFKEEVDRYHDGFDCAIQDYVDELERTIKDLTAIKSGEKNK